MLQLMHYRQLKITWTGLKRPKQEESYRNAAIGNCNALGQVYEAAALDSGALA
jgi:hypothetical protein